jgi:hypothetical protein
MEALVCLMERCTNDAETAWHVANDRPLVLVCGRHKDALSVDHRLRASLWGY